MIFKESINNAAKYSSCTEISIRFNYAHKCVEMKISDNGKGFDEVTNNGNGLRNIRDRAVSLSGDALIKSEHGKGTEVSVNLPVT